MKIFLIAAALLISVFGSNTAIVQAACVWEQYKDAPLNDYLEIRNCVGLPSSQNACTAPYSACGANGGYLAWGNADICPIEAVDGAVSSKSNGYTCFTNKTVSPPISSPESGMCYALAFKTTCSVTPPSTPVITSATAGSCGTGEITVQWGTVSDATSYEIRRDGGTAINVGNVTRTVYNGLIAEKTYSFEVRALTGSTPGNWSTKKEATAPAVCSSSPCNSGSYYLWNGRNWDDYNTPNWGPSDVVGYSMSNQGPLLSAPTPLAGSVTGVIATAFSYPGKANNLSCGPTPPSVDIRFE